MESAADTLPFACRTMRGQLVNAWFSESLHDQAWDDFLRGDPRGQFQQSCAWAQSKQSEDWRCLRVTLEQDGQVRGGFQLLWRATRFGKLGFISKGPVLPPEDAELEDFALAGLLHVVRTHGLTAIIVQPPDLSPGLVHALTKRGFAANRVMRVIEATLLVDLSDSLPGWEARLRGDRRRAVRKGRNSGTTIYEGGEPDIPRFFELMLGSCARQGVPPTPSTLEAVTQLVRAFRPAGECRLVFAVCEGEPVAAVLELRFGGRYTSWKKGWNGQYSGHKPNILLTHDSLRTASELGCDCFDFAGMERSLAETLLANQPLTGEQLQHADANKLGFGGQPRLLPPALVYFRNPWYRFAYRKMAERPWLAAKMKRFASALGV